MNVVVTETAWCDIFAIQNFIAQKDRARANTFVDALVDRCAELGENPYLWSLLPRYETSGLRRRIFRRYVIYYKVQDDVVTVLRVTHGSRDVRRLLSELAN